MDTGVVSSVDNVNWATVTLSQSYASMVVVATPAYDASCPALVTRIRNAVGNSFEVRLDRTDGSGAALPGVDVHYLVVEEGVYTQAVHGVTMEAVKYVSTVTDAKNAWVGEARSYANSYTTPVVVGQVMSYADSQFSVFWARGSKPGQEPRASALFTGKHVGGDPVTVRADETVGFISCWSRASTRWVARRCWWVWGRTRLRG